MGNRVELSQPAERIIVNYESIAEMLVTIGAADNIIGVDDATKTFRKDIMEKLRPDVKNIGKYSTPDIETISQIRPDLMIVFKNYNPKNPDQVKALNLRIVYFDSDTPPEQLNDEAYALGEMTGHDEGARRYIEFNQKYQRLVESRLTNLTDDEIPVVYGCYKSTIGEHVMTGDGAFFHLINILHARNINENLNVTSPVVNPEWIFQKDPEIIFRIGYWGSSYGYETGSDSLLSVRENFKNRPGYKTLKAIQSDRIYVYNQGLINGPRQTVGLVYFAKALYPDRFADIDPDAIRREYTEEFGFGDDDMEWFYPTFEPVNATRVSENSTPNR
jgi:iron complex transport system substrate-binding protein